MVVFNYELKITNYDSNAFRLPAFTSYIAFLRFVVIIIQISLFVFLHSLFIKKLSLFHYSTLKKSDKKHLASYILFSCLASHITTFLFQNPACDADSVEALLPRVSPAATNILHLRCIFM
jgi:hypothetical protein